MRLIDADALKECMRGEFIDSVEERIAIREIESAPTIEPKRGKWIDYRPHGIHLFDCSLCRYHASKKSNFCPNCGARMKGADDE